MTEHMYHDYLSQQRMIRLAQTLEAHRDDPLSAEQVQFIGVKRTRRHLLGLLSHYIQSASSVDDTLQRVHDVTQHLQQLQLFKTIGVKVDTLAEGRTGVTFTVQEVPRIHAVTGTQIGSGEGSLTGSIRLPSVTGVGDTLDLQSAYNRSFQHHLGMTYRMAYDRPLRYNPRSRGHLLLMKNLSDWTAWSGCMEREEGLTLSWRHAVNPFVQHELAWSAVWREIYNLSPNAGLQYLSLYFIMWSHVMADVAIRLRNESCHSIKSSLAHTWQYDTRDHPTMATTGTYLRYRNEMSGLGGTVQFFKTTLEASLHQTWSRHIWTSLTCRAGWLHPLNGKTHLSDRFMIGGPLTVRGFHQGGLGPQEGDFALGATQYAIAGLSLYSSLGYLPDWIKAHCFVNGGVVPFTSHRPSISYGLGAVLSLGGIRAELGWRLPLARQETDRVAKARFNVGIGASFL